MSKEKEQILRNLFSKHRLGIKPGLERTLRLAESVGNPHEKFKSIHVAGTNGKGTICSLAASFLIETGYKTALYTSPHIKDFNERIRINGEKISDEELIEYSETLLPLAEEIGATFFEITTVMAFLHFANKEVDAAVIETGMGGRFDSTNIIKPEVCVISDIDFDHKEFLGNSIEEIAFEKAGIIKHKTPVITTETNEKVLKVFKRSALDKSTYVTSATGGIHSKVAKIIDEKFISRAFPKNYMAAREAVTLFMCKKPTLTAQLNGLKNLAENTGYFARLQMIKTKPPFIIDISHSVAAVKNLIESVQERFPDINDWTFILALMKDKDAENIIKLLKPIIGKIIATEVQNERTLKAAQISEIAKNNEIKVEIIPDPVEAVSKVAEENHPAIITGSFYLAGEIWDELEDL